MNATLDLGTAPRARRTTGVRRTLFGQRLAVPMVLGWLGAGTTAGWGGWMLLAMVPGSATGSMAAQATPLMNLTYAVQMTAGLLMAAFAAFLLAELAAERRRT